MSDNQDDSNVQINTEGGSYIEGGVETGGGDFVGGHKIVHGNEIRNIYQAPPPPPAPLRTRIPEPRAAQLVGRATELEWVCQRLQGENTAAIAAIRGIGGMGKTELAIAAVHKLAAHFAERVIWLDCGANDIQAIQARMAAALGVELRSEDPKIRADMLAAAFQHQSMLVVLDDVRRRHLADFEALLPPRPPCAVLVTSRRDDLPLLAPTLPLPELAPTDSHVLISNLIPEAVAAEPETASVISELLKHIPLALKLAARRAERLARRRAATGQQPLATLLEELQTRRIQVLDQGGDPDRPDLSIVITFNASYDDLDAPDQVKLRRLGVFARNEFELPAIRTVWQEPDENSARQALDRLMNAGLLEEVDEDRWWMHDLLREYAAERLTRDGSDEEKTARLAHAAYWQSWLHNYTPDNVEKWRDMLSHRPEFAQAADWVLQNWSLDPELATKFAISIAQLFPYVLFKETERLLRLGLNTAMETLGNLPAPEDAETWRHRQAVIQVRLADHVSLRGEYAEAMRLYEQSTTCFGELGDWGSAAATQLFLAELLRRQGDYEKVESLLLDSERIVKESADRQQLILVRSNLANLYRTQSKYEQARDLYQTGLQEARQIGDVRTVALIQTDLADLLRVQGAYDEAEALYRDSLATKEALGDDREVAMTQAGLADLFRFRGKPEEAMQFYERSIDSLEKLGDLRSVAVTKAKQIPLLIYNFKRYDEAEQLCWDCLSHFEAFGENQQFAVAQSFLAELLSLRGEIREAEQQLRHSLEILERHSDDRATALTKARLADVLLNQGHTGQAERLYRECLEVLKAFGDSYEIGVTQLKLADLLARQEQFQEAEVLIIDSLLIFKKLGDNHHLPYAQAKLQELHNTVVDKLVAKAQGEVTLGDLLILIRLARRGHPQAEQHARQLCLEISKLDDPSKAVIGQGLLAVLEGTSPQIALADLPDDLRSDILEALNDET